MTRQDVALSLQRTISQFPHCHSYSFLAVIPALDAGIPSTVKNITNNPATIISPAVSLSYLIRQSIIKRFPVVNYHVSTKFPILPVLFEPIRLIFPICRNGLLFSYLQEFKIFIESFRKFKKWNSFFKRGKIADFW